MIVKSVDSFHPSYRGCRHNVISFTVCPENDDQRALMRALEGPAKKATIFVCSDGHFEVQFKVKR